MFFDTKSVVAITLATIGLSIITFGCYEIWHPLGYLAAGFNFCGIASAVGNDDEKPCT